MNQALWETELWIGDMDLKDTSCICEVIFSHFCSICIFLFLILVGKGWFNKFQKT